MQFSPFTLAATPYPKDLRPLTSLRFFAAFWVMLFHYVTVLPHGGIRDWALVSKGYLGVDFFFILSGFILYHVYSKDLSAGLLTARAFYLRRLARVYPLHLFTLLLYIAGLSLAFSLAQGEVAKAYMQQYAWQFNWHTIANNVLLLHGWGFERDISFNKPSWSISSEWFAYLLFPFLLPLVLKLRGYLFLLFGCGLMMAAWFVVPFLVQSDMTQLACNFSILRIMPEFIFGMALCAFGRGYALRLPPRLAFLSVLAAIIAACCLKWPDIVTVLLFGALIFAAAEAERQGRAGWLGRKWPVRLGQLSFAMYMTHFPVLDGLYIFVVVLIYNNKVPLDMFLILWFSMFALTFILAAILNRVLEEPARRWLDRRA